VPPSDVDHLARHLLSISAQAPVGCQQLRQIRAACVADEAGRGSPPAMLESTCRGTDVGGWPRGGVMMTVKQTIPILAAVVLTFGTMAVSARQAQPPAQQPPAQQAPQPKMAQGELVRVDNAAMILSVKTSSAEMQFHYTAETKVSGSDIAGLGTLAGSQVSVQYTSHGEDNIATQITVQAKKSE
jgi:hypothetical protein